MLRANQRLPRPIRPRGGTGPMHMADVRQLEHSKPEDVRQADPIAEARQSALVELAGLLFEQADEMDAGAPEVTGRMGRLARGTGGLTLGQNERTRILMHLGQAIESQTQGDNNQAAEELERAIDVGMSHPAAYFDLGMLRLERNSQRAMRYLQKAVRHPNFALASYLLMAGAAEKEENYGEAAQMYLQALRMADAQTVPEAVREELMQLYEPIIEEQTLRSDVAQQKVLCGTIRNQLMRKDWRDFLQTARQQLPVQSDGAPPLPLAEMLLQTNSSQVVEALAQVRQLTNRKLYRSAMEQAFAAIEIAPTYLPLHVQIGEILLREGQTEEAVTKFLLVVEVYNQRGEATQAINLLTRVTQMAPMDLKVRGRLIDMMVANGRKEDAIQQYMDLANMHYHLTELDKARQTYAAALKVAQQHGVDRSWAVQILYKVADIDLQRLDLRQGVRIYEQIRTLEPEDPKARTHLVELNFRLGQDSTALNEVDGYIALLEHTGKRVQAIEFLQGLMEEQNRRPELIKRLAELYARNGQVTEAVAELDWLADWLLSTGNAQGAVAMIKTIISMRPPNVEEYQTALRQLLEGKI
jgi:tetratricopeptide (TPR) repeat protein